MRIASLLSILAIGATLLTGGCGSSSTSSSGGGPARELVPTNVETATLANIGGVAYFLLEYPALGTEPWTSVGTPEETGLLKDILPGSGPLTVLQWGSAVCGLRRVGLLFRRRRNRGNRGVEHGWDDSRDGACCGPRTGSGGLHVGSSKRFKWAAVHSRFSCGDRRAVDRHRGLSISRLVYITVFRRGLESARRRRAALFSGK